MFEIAWIPGAFAAGVSQSSDRLMFKTMIGMDSMLQMLSYHSSSSSSNIVIQRWKCGFQHEEERIPSLQIEGAAAHPHTHVHEHSDECRHAHSCAQTGGRGRRRRSLRNQNMIRISNIPWS